MVSKKSLIGISALVWMVAGFNVLRLGILEYSNVFSALLVALTVVVFIPFFLMFQNMVKKNTKRILDMQESRILCLKFFPIKSYILIVCMMTFGIILRNIEQVPRYFIAFFYTGLGAGLFSAGIRYAYHLIWFQKAELHMSPVNNSESE